LYINYVLCWCYIIHVLSILCWHVFSFPKKTCFIYIYIKNTSKIQKHKSITLTWGCLCGKGMPFWRIKGVSFMRCISTHKWIWSHLCGRRVMRRHKPWPQTSRVQPRVWPLYTSRSRSTHSIWSSLRTFYPHGCKRNAIKLMFGCVKLQLNLIFFI